MSEHDWLRAKPVTVYLLRDFFIVSDVEVERDAHFPTGKIAEIDTEGFALVEQEGGEFWIPWGMVLVIERVPEGRPSYGVIYRVEEEGDDDA